MPKNRVFALRFLEICHQVIVLPSDFENALFIGGGMAFSKSCQTTFPTPGFAVFYRQDAKNAKELKKTRRPGHLRDPGSLEAVRVWAWPSGLEWRWGEWGWG